MNWEVGGGLHGWGLCYEIVGKNCELGRVTCIPDLIGIGGVRLAMLAVPCTR